MASVNVDAIAKACNLTPQRIGQLVKLGMPKAARGEYELGPCMQWYIKYLQKELERRGPAGTAGSADLESERRGLVAAQRKRVEMDNEVRQGELTEREEVRKVWMLLITNIQKRLRAIPAALGPQLTNMNDPAAIVSRMKNEIDQALTDLASGAAVNAADSAAGEPAPSTAA